MDKKQLQDTDNEIESKAPSSGLAVTVASAATGGGQGASDEVDEIKATESKGGCSAYSPSYLAATGLAYAAKPQEALYGGLVIYDLIRLGFNSLSDLADGVVKDIIFYVGLVVAVGLWLWASNRILQARNSVLVPLASECLSQDYAKLATTISSVTQTELKTPLLAASLNSSSEQEEKPKAKPRLGCSVNYFILDVVFSSLWCGLVSSAFGGLNTYAMPDIGDTVVDFTGWAEAKAIIANPVVVSLSAAFVIALNTLTLRGANRWFISQLEWVTKKLLRLLADDAVTRQQRQKTLCYLEALRLQLLVEPINQAFNESAAMAGASIKLSAIDGYLSSLMRHKEIKGYFKQFDTWVVDALPKVNNLEQSFSSLEEADKCPLANLFYLLPQVDYPPASIQELSRRYGGALFLSSVGILGLVSLLFLVPTGLTSLFPASFTSTMSIPAQVCFSVSMSFLFSMGIGGGFFSSLDRHKNIQVDSMLDYGGMRAHPYKYLANNLLSALISMLPNAISTHEVFVKRGAVVASPWYCFWMAFAVTGPTLMEFFCLLKENEIKAKFKLLHEDKEKVLTRAYAIEENLSAIMRRIELAPQAEINKLLLFVGQLMDKRRQELSHPRVITIQNSSSVSSNLSVLTGTSTTSPSTPKRKLRAASEVLESLTEDVHGSDEDDEVKEIDQSVSPVLGVGGTKNLQ